MNKFPVEITKRERVQIQGERQIFCGAAALALAASSLPSGHQTSSANGNIIICWVQLLPTKQSTLLAGLEVGGRQRLELGR